MNKLKDRVQVETFLHRIHCPNKDCKEGMMEHDGFTRNQRTLPTTELQYRHVCSAGCGAGLWLTEKYPKVEYKLVESPKVKVENYRAAPAVVPE